MQEIVTVLKEGKIIADSLRVSYFIYSWGSRGGGGLRGLGDHDFLLIRYCNQAISLAVWEALTNQIGHRKFQPIRLRLYVGSKGAQKGGKLEIVRDIRPQKVSRDNVGYKV